MMAEHAAQDDPHAQIHDLAAAEHPDHEPVLGAADGDDSIEDKLNKVDQRLTGRINDLRRDFDTSQRAVSKSVGAFKDDVDSLKTATGNNKASIDALAGAVSSAERQAKAAKKAADDSAAATAALQQAVTALTAAYQAHTHPVTITMSGQTEPPRTDQPKPATGNGGRQ